MVYSAIGALFVWGLWISRLMFQGKGQLYSRGARYFKGSPADRESDSALAEFIPWDAVCVRVTCSCHFFLQYLHLLVQVRFSSCHWPLRWPSTNDDKRDGVGLLFRLPCMLFTEYSLGNRGCAHTHTHTHTPLQTADQPPLLRWMPFALDCYTSLLKKKRSVSKLPLRDPWATLQVHEDVQFSLPTHVHSFVACGTTGVPDASAYGETELRCICKTLAKHFNDSSLHPSVQEVQAPFARTQSNPEWPS